MPLPCRIGGCQRETQTGAFNRPATEYNALVIVPDPSVQLSAVPYYVYGGARTARSRQRYG